MMPGNEMTQREGLRMTTSQSGTNLDPMGLNNYKAQMLSKVQTPNGKIQGTRNDEGGK
jgi:hypothetical protein